MMTRTLSILFLAGLCATSFAQDGAPRHPISADVLGEPSFFPGVSFSIQGVLCDREEFEPGSDLELRGLATFEHGDTPQVWMQYELEAVGTEVQAATRPDEKGNFRLSIEDCQRDQFHLLFLDGDRFLAKLHLRVGNGAIEDEGGLPTTLDGLLAVALQDNPDVRLATAELDTARARLEQTHLKVARDVVKLFSERQRLESEIKDLGDRRERVTAQVKAGVASTEERRRATAAYVDARAALATVEAELAYLLGKRGRRASSASLPPSTRTRAGFFTAAAPEAPPAPRAPSPFEKKIDDLMLTVDFQDSAVEEVLEFLQQSTGLTFTVSPEADRLVQSIVSFAMADASLRKILNALADTSGCSFIVRDYGFLLTTRDAARSFDAVKIPADQSAPVPGSRRRR